MDITFKFPKKLNHKKTLKDVIWDFKDNVSTSDEKNYIKNSCEVLKHEYMLGGCEHLYRRLSIKECARIESFPDNHNYNYS